MDKKKNYIADAQEKAAREHIEPDKEMWGDRTRSSFAREKIALGGFLEGFFLSSLLALVPLIALAGLVIWAFGFSNDSEIGAWVFFGLAALIYLFVMSRALKSKHSSNVSLLAGMMETFWMGVFPIILIGVLVVLGIASWLAISFQAAFALLCVLGLIGFVLITFVTQS